MTSQFFAPAAQRTTALLDGFTDEQLGAPTPCTEYSLGDLVEHVGVLCVAFTAAAAKDFAGTARAPQPDASTLAPGWRTDIPNHLEVLAKAWRDPEAWTGMTQIAGLDLPGQLVGIIALTELTVHGWDLAVASGQAYAPADDELAVVLQHLTALTAPEQAAIRSPIFGPVVPVPADAPLLDQVLGLSGRDPSWHAT